MSLSSSSTAVGYAARAQAFNSTTIGATAGLTTASEGATSIGANSRGIGFYSITIGASDGGESGPQASGAFSIAISGGRTAVNQVERGARAQGNAAIAIGHRSNAINYGTAVGSNTKATVLGATALGTDASATADSTVAVGRFAGAIAVSASAFGPYAYANHPRSVAIGSNSQSRGADTVSIGRPGAERRIVNVKAAVLATDAVNLAQVKSLIAAARSPLGPKDQGAGDASGEQLLREMAELRALVTDLKAVVDNQQREIARLNNVPAAAADTMGR